MSNKKCMTWDTAIFVGSAVFIVVVIALVFVPDVWSLISSQ